MRSCICRTAPPLPGLVGLETLHAHDVEAPCGGCLRRCEHAVQVLKFYNLEGQSKWLNLLYESCFLVLFLILAWYAAAPLQ